VWHYKDNATCDCGKADQTMNHIVETCPKILFEEGIIRIHQITKENITNMT